MTARRPWLRRPKPSSSPRSRHPWLLRNQRPRLTINARRFQRFILLGHSGYVAIKFFFPLQDDFVLTHLGPPTAPLRFFLSMLLVFYSYAFSPTSPLFSSSSSSSTRRPGVSHKGSGSGTDHLHNRLLFAFAFIEMMAWFWTWITLREERGAILEKMKKQHDKEAHSH